MFTLDVTEILLLGMLGALAIEGITAMLRFRIGLRADAVTPRTLKRLTFGLHVHHSYTGVAGLGTGLALSGLHLGWWTGWVAAAGLAMLLSDLLHHFAVLWPITGDHEFRARWPE